ncbi:phage gp6-like head-tail connector protein [Streptomyces ipomoeae]|uniref:phage gp6-like head-tail connector protein n=1 Tax=Streptomyces ipomoeae TaxID=103232 RepID=UPI0029B0DE18|nr:phage gp6-like head-tail connector protein [Streptomyces ipomoeae]MDX2692956.1 phage gp6-like head-tail connector protein [Streptomyces ipomoeae]MDX2840688.1 phage gp6-like head-tail connector protein [Streptomyces ipomoeae]
MANEYGDLPTLRRRAGLEASDTTQDVDLESVRAAVSGSINLTCGRRFWLDPAPVARIYRPRGRVVWDADGEILLVDDIGSVAGLVVETGPVGGPWTAVTGYETVPDNALAGGKPVTGLLLPNSTWSRGSTTRVRVTTRFGWPAVPPDITEATYLQSTRLYKRKNSPEGVMGSAEWGVVRLSRRDPDVWNLIEPYILPGFG